MSHWRNNCGDGPPQPEQAARELLGHALHRMAEEEAWHDSSQRRVELIQKNRNFGLTAEEGREFNCLQAAIDQRLEARDRQLLGVAEEFRQLAERLPDATEKVLAEASPADRMAEWRRDKARL